MGEPAAKSIRWFRDHLPLPTKGQSRGKKSYRSPYEMPPSIKGPFFRPGFLLPSRLKTFPGILAPSLAPSCKLLRAFPCAFKSYGVLSKLTIPGKIAGAVVTKPTPLPLKKNLGSLVFSFPRFFRLDNLPNLLNPFLYTR